MLELLESPGDRFCDKLKNEENCDDDSQAGSPLAIIEDTAPSNNTHFFEGVEKNLEVWFTSSNGDTDQSDLRLIPRYQLLFKGKGHLTLAYCFCWCFPKSWQPSYCQPLTQLETDKFSSRFLFMTIYYNNSFPRSDKL